MGRYTEIPSTLPDGDPGVKLFSEPRTVDAVDVQVTAVINVDPTDPTIQQAVDATYGAAVDVKRLPTTEAEAIVATATALGAPADAEATSGNGSVIGILKALRTALGNIYTGLGQIYSVLTGTLTVSGSVTTGGLTDAQLRASAVPVSLATAPLPSDAATQTTLALVKAKTDNLDVAASTLATATAQTTGNASLSSLETRAGSVTETAPATDTASSGHNGRLQRIAQRITSLIALLPASLGQKAMSASLAVTVASDQSPVPVSASDGSSVALGAKADAAWDTGDGTLIAILKAIANYFLGTSVVPLRYNTTTSQTNDPIVSVSGGTKIVVYEAEILHDANSTAKPACIVGFGASTTPTTTGVLVSHPGLPPGGGVATRLPLIGGAGESLRITCGTPTAGSITVLLKYRTK